MTADSPDGGDRRHRPHRPGRAHSHSHDNSCDASPGHSAERGDGAPTVAAQSPPRPPNELSRDAQRRLQAARLWIAANRPYYAKALFSCAVIPTAAPRISIDEEWRIYANGAFLESLTVERAAAELVHVLNHVLRDHAPRARNAGVDAITAPLWNVASDCEINDDLHEDDLIDDTDYDQWLFPETFGMDDLLPAEHYYRQLLDGAVPAEVSVSDACGSGCHSHPAPHELPADTAPLSDLDQKLVRHSVASAIAGHRKLHGPGSIPHGLDRWAAQTLNPTVDWRQKLAAALRTSTHHTTGTADYTWQRPSRRQQPQDPVLRPAMTRPVPSITVVVDTSGSMSDDELDRALTEISAIIATVVPGDSVRVLSVDTEVHTDQRIHNTSQISLQGCGGTDMAAGIAAAAATSPDAIVVITDGWTPWPPTRPAGARCVIAALTDQCESHDVPGWIQTIDVSEHPAS